MKWIPVNEDYPGIPANETINMKKKAFFHAAGIDIRRQCVNDQILTAIQNIHQLAITEGTAAFDAAASLFANFPTLCEACLQTVDRQLRFLMVDDAVRNGGWKTNSIDIFWKLISEMDTYKDLGLFMLEVTNLPQSTAEVDRTFSKISSNKTKLRYGCE